jgi:hypothetical protein
MTRPDLSVARAPPQFSMDGGVAAVASNRCQRTDGTYGGIRDSNLRTRIASLSRRGSRVAAHRENANVVVSIIYYYYPGSFRCWKS